MDSLLYYLFIAFAFLAVVLLLEGSYFIWHHHQGPKAKRIRKRLHEVSMSGMDTPDTHLLKQRLLSNSPPLHRLLLRIPRISSLDRLLLQSGMPLVVIQFISHSAMTSIGAMAVATILGFSSPVILLCAVGGGLIPYFYVLRAKNKRLKIIEQQLPEIIDLMSRTLKAGHAFPGALQIAGTEGPEPAASEFLHVFDEINFGVPAQNALMSLATRIPITDLRYFVIAVLIQRESGGNLTELLEKISGLIRERLTLHAKVRVLSAEGRLSAWILSSLPFAMALLLSIINPDFISVLWKDPMGLVIIAITLGMMIMGIFVMSRIIKIRV
ncbi:type II secretion system F family protein [Nitrosomonas sp. Nm33]|uniref:type II secretion system F family protein n=1 Tax=Nitrosomonas sp. Nm33 TaxID=133724 RepID=UPI0008964849|nr:type II secretion system F family protein [Nitrosomonas sp. Nm33]SDY03491.1 tight adherence protein B [Nitrosomonas sp. Nm33]